MANWQVHWQPHGKQLRNSKATWMSIGLRSYTEKCKGESSPPPCNSQKSILWKEENELNWILISWCINLVDSVIGLTVGTLKHTRHHESWGRRFSPSLNPRCRHLPHLFYKDSLLPLSSPNWGLINCIARGWNPTSCLFFVLFCLMALEQRMTFIYLFVCLFIHF